MDSLQQLEKRIRNILRKADWPVSVEYLTDCVRDLLEPSEEVISNYSPFESYESGQRLFHPINESQGWFTVEVISPDTIKAHFDDGRIMKLSQNLADETKIQGMLLQAHQGPKDLLKDILAGMEDVRQIGSLYAQENYFDHFPLHRVSNIKSLEKYLLLRRKYSPAYTRVTSKELSKLVDSLGIESLYYILPIDNLSSVLENGILCRNLAPRSHMSFANEEIQINRHQIIPCQDIGFNLHDYVPLFFSERPPLLYSANISPIDTVKIFISPKILLEPGAIFFDMNAVSDSATLFNDIRELPNLNWEIIHRRYYGRYYSEREHINYLYRQAEADIPLRIMPKFFAEIVASNDQALIRAILAVLETGMEIPYKTDDNFL